jgi:predicted ester cyclase
MSKYLEGHSMDVVTDNAVFTVMGSGKSYKGHKEIDGLLEYFYHQAFDAKAETKKMIVSDGAVVLEADFVGKHKGEFAGKAATGKNVRVPMCISYELQNDRITSAHIYFEIDSFLQQVGNS